MLFETDRSAARPPTIHPTALVDAGAQLGNGCVIHAYAIIGPHCVLEEGVEVHPFAVLGGPPQDLSADPRIIDSGVRIGRGTVIREHVTINRATGAGSATVVGAQCFLMAAAHVAHDCRVGDHVVMANAVLLGGHVRVGDHAFLGGGAVIHQRCRIGESAMVGGGSRISEDIAPFCLAAERNLLAGLNLVGLRRRGFSGEVIGDLKRAYRALDAPAGNLRTIAAAALLAGEFKSDEARRLLEFFQSGSRRFVRSRRAAAGSESRDQA